MLRNFFSDIVFRMISLLSLHTGAILRYIFNHFTSRKRYSYHAFIVNAPLLDHSGMPYREAFNEWKGQQDERNRHACTQLNAKQQQVIFALSTPTSSPVTPNISAIVPLTASSDSSFGNQSYL